MGSRCWSSRFPSVASWLIGRCQPAALRSRELFFVCGGGGSGGGGGSPAGLWPHPTLITSPRPCPHISSYGVGASKHDIWELGV